MAELGIGEVARRAGIAASAVRYYESEGLIPRPPRRSGRRIFDESVVARLALIDLAKRAGFSVAEIRRLLAGFSGTTPPGERWRNLAERKREELSQRLRETRRMQRILDRVVRCKCPTFDDCARELERRPAP